MATSRPEECVFCEGAESLTPPEVYSVRTSGQPDEPGWTARVVPNLYPAVKGPGRYHEVVVHSPSHKTRLAELDEPEIAAVGRSWLSRLEHISADPSAAYFQVGVNQGREAGASRAHSHSQLFAVDVEPPIWKSESAALASQDDCSICKLATEGSAFAERDAIVGLCPPWSEFAYETILVPRRHSATPLGSESALADVLGLASALDLVYEEVCGADSFNLVVHTALLGVPERDFHWHAHLYPRRDKLASVELGSGIHICTKDPELAAEELAEALRHAG